MASVESQAHPGTPAKILVLSTDATSAGSTTEVLTSLGYEAVACTDSTRFHKLIQAGDFDVVLAEHAVSMNNSSAAQESVDNVLELIGLDSSVPTVVAVDPSLTDVVVEAKNRGAADIMGVPMSTQHDKLSSLWRFARRLMPSCTAVSSKDSCCSSDMLLVADDSLSGDDYFNLDDLELEPLDGEYNYEADMPSIAGSESSAHSLCHPFHDTQESGTLLQDASVTPVPDAASSPTLKKRAFSSIGSVKPYQPQNAKPNFSPAGSPAPSTASSETIGFENDLNEDKPKSGKKMKVEWTRELHDRFVQAVEALGADKAVPSRILECMGEHGCGLTRQNIASHLQKYRYRSRGKGFAEASLSASASAAQKSAQGFPMPSVSPGPVVVTPGSNPGHASPTLSPQLGAQQWIQAIPIWSPWPQSAVVQPVMPGQGSSQGLNVTSMSSGTTAPVVSAELRKAIRETLLQRKWDKMPLGLNLDKAQVLQRINPSAKNF